MKKYKCPCCNFKTLTEQPEDSFEVCPVCAWENDPVQNSDPTFTGGANKPSLEEARANFKNHGVSDIELKHLSRSPLANEIDP